LFKLLAGLKLQSEILSEWTQASIAVTACREQQLANPNLSLARSHSETPREETVRKSFSRN
jgi:hypothetical protein